MKRVGIPPEAIFWTAAILALAVVDPATPSPVELCLFKRVGFEACPGCGLGHGLSYLLHLDFTAAIESHPLSPFALLIILGRIRTLLSEGVRARRVGPNIKPLLTT